MSKGRSNKLTGQIGEYLVCAELGKRGLIATPFAGNVPAFDILAADDLCRTLPLQVKASRSGNWPSDARIWMNISFDKETEAQENLGATTVQNPNLIYVCVAIAPPDEGEDRFFVLTKIQLQTICIQMYSDWMDKRDWKRPRNPESYDCRYRIPDIQSYENNWQLIENRLALSNSHLILEN